MTALERIRTILKLHAQEVWDVEVEQRFREAINAHRVTVELFSAGGSEELTVSVLETFYILGMTAGYALHVKGCELPKE